MKNLVIVESGAKATKITEYLDKNFPEQQWEVAACLGHIRDLPDDESAVNPENWADLSWEETQDDPRPILLNYEEFEISRSPNHLWNLCQTSLRHHGELHNNVRMTWGKAFPLWTENVETSMSWCLNINDKYALDGRDPSSIAGVQWCHGLFDRPFTPSVPVMGIVRQRDLSAHESRLDMEAFENNITRPVIDVEHPIVVVGAGYAGAMAARCLSNNGIGAVSYTHLTLPTNREV